VSTAYSDIFALARQCQKAPREEVLVTLSGSELVAFHRRIADARTTPGRRAVDKVDLVAAFAKLSDQVSSVLDELHATRHDLAKSDAALKLAVALLNRERGFTTPQPTAD
jgi:hypothetical protein